MVGRNKPLSTCAATAGGHHQGLDEHFYQNIVIEPFSQTRGQPQNMLFDDPDVSPAIRSFLQEQAGGGAGLRVSAM